jgi:hypothetical protein
MPLSISPSPYLLRACVATIALLGGALGSGCVSTDLVRGAERELDRALRIERPTVFYEPILAKARSATGVAPVSPDARQHYLGVIANMEFLSPEGKGRLKREGMLGNALAMKLIAQWRLGRLDSARESLRELRSVGQVSPEQRVRALVAAFSGIARIEDAITANQSGQPFETVLEIIVGENGAWHALGTARMEAARAGNTPPELLETRLAAFKVLKNAHDRVPPASPLSDTLETGWKRARAEAQIELAEFASLPSSTPIAHAAKVLQWQTLCALDPLPR